MKGIKMIETKDFDKYIGKDIMVKGKLAWEIETTTKKEKDNGCKIIKER